MINKIKNMTGKIIILVLMLIMLIPATAFAGMHTVNNWHEYEEKLIEDIMKQEKTISIKFNGNEIFSTEYAARLKIANAYEEAKVKMPNIYSGLNVVSETTGVVLDGTLNAHLKNITHTITYKNSKQDFVDIKAILNDEYKIIKTEITDYEKIKAAYDYVVAELENAAVGRNISEILSKQEDNAHAVLFSMMMTELGYDNDIATGDDGTKWNLVKVQGKWYHVNAAVAGKFLIINDGLDWDKEKHGGKSFSTEDYVGNPPTLPQIKYEIELIYQEIDKTLVEINNISEEISIEDIRETKKIFAVIEEKVESYEERKDILKAEAESLGLGLSDEFTGLETKISGITSKIKTKKDLIANKAVTEAKETFKLVDISAAKEAITMIENKEPLEGQMNALEVAVVAIIKAEQSKLVEDITLAEIAINNDKISDFKIRFNIRIKVLKATIAVENAEKTRIPEDVTLANGLVDLIKDEDEETWTNLNARLKAISVEITAKEAVELAEQALKNNNSIDEIRANITTAQTSINETSTGSIKTQLQNRIDDVQAAIDAIELVDNAETCINGIPELEPLTATIAIAEDKVKIAEVEVKKIKDIGVRTNQLTRIKDIKLVITALKAVDKAETVKSTTNVKSAKTATGKIVKTEHEGTKIILSDRIVKIENSIKFEDAERLIEKVEISLKRADYEKAEIAVNGLDTTKDEGLALEIRRSDVYDIILAKEAVENAEKQMKANKGTVEVYSDVVKTASDANEIVDKKYNPEYPAEPINPEESKYKEYQGKYGVIIGNLNNRTIEMNAAIDAIKSVNTARTSYEKYLLSSINENKLTLENDIEVAKVDIGKIEDRNTNLSSIKKSLVSSVKVFSDRLNADADYNAVSSELVKIEVKLIDVELAKVGTELDDAIEELEGRILGIIELSKKVKVSSQSKDLKDRTAAINDVIAATKAVVKAEVKDEKTVLKDIAAANKTVEKLSVIGIHKKIINIGIYKGDLDSRIKILERNVKTSNDESKAETLVDKAISSKKETDIKLAIEAVAKLEEGTEAKNKLSETIEEKIVKLLIIDGNNVIITTISSIELNDKSVLKNVTEAKKAVQLVNNVILLVNGKLEPIGNAGEDYASKYKADTIDLNNSIKVIDISVEALKAVQQAEKTKKQEDVHIANTAINKIWPVDPDNPVDPKYENMLIELNKRIKAVEVYLDGETTKETTAKDAVKLAEDNMTIENNPTNEQLRNAQDAVNKVSDKIEKAKLQKRIDAINLAITAKFAVERAEAYTEATGVKAAEKALNNLVKAESYLNIVIDLGDRIAQLNNQLNISKLVTEATNLVHKAVTSRVSADSIKARLAVEAIKEFVLDPNNEDDPYNPYNSLKKMLDDLDKSIENEAGDQTAALADANMALKKAIEEIHGKEATDEVEAVDGVNTDITNIIEGEHEEANIKKAYARIQVAKNYIIAANATALKLGSQNKGLLKEIDYVNKEIELAEDNIDVKEAVRLVTKASSSVTKATTEEEKAKAKLDIAAARRATDKIGHNDNKAIKVTISNTINSIEKKLRSDNDQELIDLAVKEVNSAAEILANAVKENKVLERQEEIDKAIFSAKMAIGWISDNNKTAKITLTGFIDDISSIFEAEKKGIANEERIKNAEKAVKDAEEESKKENNDLESFIRQARLRVKMIENDSLETEAKIIDLNTRLDILEGKDGSSSDSGGSINKPGGSTGGSSKPGSSGTTVGNIIPTTPLSDKDRVIGTTEPVWGRTNRLKKTNPVTSISPQNIAEFRIYESKIKIAELSNILKIMQSPNVKLVVRGKNINLDSKAYIHDKQNNSILVPIKFLGDELGFVVSLVNNPVANGPKRLSINGIVDGNTKSIIMDLGSEYCYVNGNLVKTSSKPVIHGGRTYIPVDLMVEHFGLTFSYYNEGKNIQLIIN